MAKKINLNRLTEGSLFKKSVAEAEALLKVIKGITVELKKSAEASKKVLSGKQTFGTAEEIEKVEKEIKKVNVVTAESLKLKKQNEIISARLVAIQKKEGQALLTTRVQMQEANRVGKQNAIITNKITGEYKRQSTLLTILRTRFKDLAAQNKGNTAEAKKLLREVTKLDAKLKQIDATVGQNQRSVGNYRLALGGLRAGFIRVAQAAGLTLGVFGAFRVIRSSISIVRDFEKQNAVLAGVLDTTRENISALTDDAIRLGSITAKTATEVTGLQIALSRLGFAENEIIDLTEPLINGSIALNAELDETAQLVGAMVNTFDDFSTADAPAIIDQLTAATQKSALQFESLNTALPIVAGAANAAGIPFTKLVALLGKLSDAGIDASMSATSLRNIFIESAGQGLDFNEILEKIKGSQDKLTSSFDEFGKRAAVPAAVLAQNIDSVKELDEVLLAAGGTAERVAKVQLATLDGAILLLTSAWEGLILDLNDGGTFISGPLTSAIRFLTENLRTILLVITGLVASFIAFKLAVAATNAIQKANIITTRIWGSITAIATGKIKLATIAQRAFNLVAKANPIGLLVGALTAAAIAFGIFKDDAEEATEAEDDFNSEAEETNRILAKRREILRDLTKENGLNRITLEALRTSLASAKKELEGLSTASITGQQRLDAFFQAGAESAEDIVTFIRDRLNLEIERLNQALLDKRIALGLDKEIKERESLIEVQRELLKIANARSEATEPLIAEKNREIKTINEEIRRLQALGIEKKKQDKEAVDRLKRDRDRAEAEITFQKEAIAEAEEIGKSLERLENDRFENDLKRAGIFGIKLKDLTEDQEEALESLEDIHSKNVLAILKKREEDKAALLAKKRAEELAAAEEAAAIQREQFQATVDAISEIARAGSAERIKVIDEELEDRRDRQAQLLESAKKGSEDITDNLAFEQRREAELRAQKAKEIERQKRIELGLTALNVFNAKIQAGDTNALGSTIKDITLLTAFIRSIPAFYEGTDDTGDGGNLDANGGFRAVLHRKEQVWSESDRSEVGFRTRSQIKDIVGAHDMGELSDAATWDSPRGAVVHRFESNDSILRSIDKRLKDLPGNIDMPKESFRFLEEQKLMRHTIKTNKKTTNNYYKVPRLFG